MNKFDIEKHPKTFCYIVENDTFNRRCNKCGSVVLKEDKDSDYKFQCVNCDENLYVFETHVGYRHNDIEFNKMCINALSLELD